MTFRKLTMLLSLVLSAGLPALIGQQSQPADFSGVYYTIRPPVPGLSRAQGKDPSERPTRSAPGSTDTAELGPNAPSLTPEYKAKLEVIRKSLISGSPLYDMAIKCLPAGMPKMMNMDYGMEVMQTKDKITFFSEVNDQLRRVYLDGRKPTQKILDDPTYAGYSTGRWAGDTLVVETVALRAETFMDIIAPHSDAMTVQERIRFASPGILEDRITVTDPKALTKPWDQIQTYRKAAPGKDELREFACPEGLADAK